MDKYGTWNKTNFRNLYLNDKAEKCGNTHIFDLGDDAVCDICGVPKSEIVDMDQYRKDWKDRIDRDTS